MRAKLHQGFSLLEITIGLAIIGIAMVAFTQMMSGAFKGQRRIDDKAKQQDFANRVQNIIYDQQSCTAALLTGDPIIFDSRDLPAFNNDPVKPKVTLAFGDGTKLKEGSNIDTLSLRVRNEMLPAGSGKYEGSLFMGAPGVSSKSVLRPSDLGLVLLTIPEGTGGTLRRVTACFSRNDVDGERTCETLGGKWIKSISRCLFGSELKLSSNEWIDPNEFKAGGALEGAFVTKCFYRFYNTVTSYLCWNVTSSMIARCMFDGDGGPSSTGWVVKHASHPVGRYRIKCDNGVLINLPDSSFKFYSDNEITDKVYTGSVPSGADGTAMATPITKENFITNYDILDNVSQCYTDPNGVTTVKCNQGDNAVEGKVNSCLYIDGGYATANANVETPYTKPKYTGWITVGSPRTTVVLGSGLSRYTAVQEASGRKCYMVQGTPSSSDKTVSGLVTDVKDPFDTNITNVLKDPVRYQQVKECVFLGGQDSGGMQPSPVSSPNPPTYASSYRGRYLMRYACNNGGIDTANLTGQVNGDPSLNAKSCWYFENVPVATDFYTNSGVATSGARRTYTGWMYLRANLTNATHTTDPNTNYVKQNAGPTNYTNAVPCNAGVRFTQ